MPYEVVAEKQLKSGSFEIRGTSTRLGNLLFSVGAAFLKVRECMTIGVWWLFGVCFYGSLCRIRSGWMILVCL